MKEQFGEQSKEAERVTYDELNRYFSHKEVSEDELKRIAKYRESCIKYVSGRSTTYRDIPTEFNEMSLHVFNDSLIFSRMFGNIIESLERRNEFFKGRTIIDIGSGPDVANLAFNMFGWGAKKFVAVDIDMIPDVEYIKDRLKKEENLELKEDQIQAAKEDLLSYLLKTLSGSAFVISSGVLTLGDIIPNDARGVDYLHFLIKEIERVTPKGGITFHYSYSPEIEKFLENSFDLIYRFKGANNGSLWRKKEPKKE